MLQEAGVEVESYVHLVVEKCFEAVHRDLIAIDVDVFQRRGEVDGASDLGFGDLHGALIVTVARLIADFDPAIYVVLDPRRRDIDVGPEKIAVFEAVIIVPIDRRWSIEEPGNTVVGIVVGLLVQIAEREPRRRAETERERRRNSEAPILRDISPRDSLIDAHQIETQRSLFADRLVDVGRDATRRVAAKHQRAIDERAIDGNFAPLIDDTAGGTSAECD